MSDKIKKLLENDHNRVREKQSDLISRYYPYAQDYYDRLNPVFFEQYEFKKDNVALLRDGMWGIINFFYKYPTPANKENVIFVASEFEKLIPRAWLQNCYLYCDSQLLDNHKRSQFILTSHFTQDFFFKKNSDELFKHLPKEGYEKYYLCNDFKEFIFDEKIDEIDLRNKCLREFILKYQSKSEIISKYYTFFLKNSFKDYAFYPHEKGSLLIYDSYTYHLFSSKGAKSLLASSSHDRNVLCKYQLSPFHYREILEVNKNNSRFSEIYIELKKMLKGEELRYNGTYYLMLSKHLLDIIS